MDALQRAAGGGIAAGRTWSEWASEGGLKGKVGEPENRLRYQRKHMSVCMSGYRWIVSSRVAPQELFWNYSSCPCKCIVWDESFLFCPDPETERRNAL